MEQKPWYWIDDLTQLDTPALVVYPDRVKQNIAYLTGAVNNVGRLRPHVKTNKSREATGLMMEAGIHKFKCSTIAEAEMLAMIDAPDVLLAYQPNETKMHRLLDLIKTYPATKFSCLVDNLTTARQLSDLAVAADRVVPVYVDLNVGMNRTGIAPGEDVLTLYAELDQLPGVQPVGLHAYDGHLRDPDIAIRTAKCDAAFWPVQLLRDTLAARGFVQPVIVVGGSPTFPIHAKRPDVECSPGTFIYWDKGYQTILSEQAFQPAVLVVSRVISLPDSTKVCLDVGHKSVAAECELSQRILFLNAPELRAIGQSEEHLVVEAGEDHPYKVGDVLYGIPNHICPTVALYERANTIENGTITGEWRTISRDRLISI
ncbi:D-TA family PLP-dependent enzyme [Spirosoma flavum]|uniref:D-TA family PLP-dependent enzyme n=1 Tax=Spirosoma flavum TaxID=2048557 RepID=A0ABW6AGL3_9BACT